MSHVKVLRLPRSGKVICARRGAILASSNLISSVTDAALAARSAKPMTNA